MTGTSFKRKITLHYFERQEPDGRSHEVGAERTAQRHPKTMNFELDLPMPPADVDPKSKKNKVVAGKFNSYKLIASKYDELSKALKGLGFYMPAGHLSLMVDAVYRQNTQIGIRTPFKQTADRLLATPDDPNGVFAYTGDKLFALHADHIFSEMMNLATLRGRVNKYYADAAKKTGLLSLKATTQSHDSQVKTSGTPDKTQSKTVKIAAKILTKEKEINDRLTEAAKDLTKVMRSVMSAQGCVNVGDVEEWLAVLEDDINVGTMPNVASHRNHYFSEEAKKPTDAPGRKVQSGSAAVVDLSGYIAVSQILTVEIGLDNKGSMGVEVAVPVMLALDNGTTGTLPGSGEKLVLENGVRPLTEGYHFFRILPEAGSGDAFTTEIHRDHLLQNNDFCKALVPEYAGKNPPSVFAQTDTNISGSLDKNSYVDAGALLLTPPEDDVCHIYFFGDRDDLGDGLRAELRAKQSSAKELNMIALSTVAYMCGELYGDPNYIMTKIEAKTEDLKIWKRAGASFVGGLAVLTTILSGGTTLAVALVGLGVLGLKRGYATSSLDVALASLKDPKFMEQHLAEVVDDDPEKLLESEAAATYKSPEESKKVRKALEAADKAGKKLAEANAAALAAQSALNTAPAKDEGKAKKALESAEKALRQANEASVKATKKHDEAMEGALVDDCKLETNLMINGDVGDILRRSFVHLLIASKSLKAAKAMKDKDKKAKELGDTLHHLQKGWRYLGPGVVFMGYGLREFKAAKEAWSSVSSVAALNLIQRFLALRIEGKLAEEPSALIAQVGEFLTPTTPKKRKWRIFKDGRVGLAPHDAEFLFKKRLEVFKKSMDTPSQGIDASSLEPAHSVQLPDKALFAKWQIKGGAIEPYAVTETENKRTKGGGKTIANETHALMFEKLKQIREHLVTRERFYTAALTEGDAAEVNVEMMATLEKLRAAIAENGGKTRESWITANDVKWWKRAPHSLRNYNYRKTKVEKSIAVGKNVGSMVAGMWINLGFGEFMDTITFNPSGKPGRFFTAMGENDSDRFKGKTEDEQLHEWGERFAEHKLPKVVNSAANTASHAAITGVAEFAITKYAGVMTDGSKAGEMEETELLSKRSMTQTITDKFISDYVGNTGDKDSSSKKDIKAMSAYVGSDILKAVGAGMRKWEKVSKALEKSTKSDFEPKKKLRDRLPGKGKASHVQGLTEMSARIAVFAKFYSEIASLEANFVICLTYLSMMDEIARSLENATFKELGLDGFAAEDSDG